MIVLLYSTYIQYSLLSEYLKHLPDSSPDRSDVEGEAGSQVHMLSRRKCELFKQCLS